MAYSGEKDSLLSLFQYRVNWSQLRIAVVFLVRAFEMKFVPSEDNMKYS